MFILGVTFSEFMQKTNVIIGIVLAVLVCLTAIVCAVSAIIAITKDMTFVELWDAWFEAIKNFFSKAKEVEDIVEESGSAVNVLASCFRG